MASEQDIRNALSVLKGPDGKTPFLRSGLFGGVSIQGDKAYLSLIADPAQVKALESLRTEVERAVLSVKGIDKALVTFTAERPPQAGGAAPGPRAQAANARSTKVLEKILDDALCTMRSAEHQRSSDVFVD